ncbi:HAMP domain-containing histidine kinase [Sulfurimonas sp. MAG313]|nr:HAMP domain-containing sensor histidine kinase [Sulfurimonas sp. MAG313]MDF1880737.1 HAMP domain-containing histidine kinase [Sulfurimonas sp. MAG313]
MIRFHLSLFSKIASSLTLLFIAAMLSIGYLIIIEQNNSVQKEKDKLVLSSVKTLAEGSIDALITGDFELLERWLKAVTPTDIYAYGYLSDPNGLILVHTDSQMIGHISPSMQSSNLNGSRNLLYHEQEVKEIIYTSSLDGEIFAYAHIAYYTSQDFLSMFKREGFFTIIGFMLFFLTLILFATLFIIKRYTEPIVVLTKSVSEFSFTDNKQMLNKALSNRPDEIGLLAMKFHQMTQRLNKAYKSLKEDEQSLQIKVKERTKDLEEKNTLLIKMQDQLVEAEKMSALGSLVAGVAHEVNTPLGISITAASIFKYEITKIDTHLKSNTLSESELKKFLITILETDEILMKNLDRAALLIKNFKKISIDQSSEMARDFELNEYLQEILSTFKNELKSRPISLELDLNKEEISMYSYPGAISQVIVNLLQNSLLHAFEIEQKGTIIISTRKKDETIIIRFCDDGKGIDESIKHKIYEPFVTTKRNKGGTGLGLNVTYNLVTQHLGGTIKIDNSTTIGACFIIEIPFKLKNKEE